MLEGSLWYGLFVADGKSGELWWLSQNPKSSVVLDFADAEGVPAALRAPSRASSLSCDPRLFTVPTCTQTECCTALRPPSHRRMLPQATIPAAAKHFEISAWSSARHNAPQAASSGQQSEQQTATRAADSTARSSRRRQEATRCWRKTYARRTRTLSASRQPSPNAS